MSRAARVLSTGIVGWTAGTTDLARVCIRSDPGRSGTRRTDDLFETLQHAIRRSMGSQVLEEFVDDTRGSVRIVSLES